MRENDQALTVAIACEVRHSEHTCGFDGITLPNEAPTQPERKIKTAIPAMIQLLFRLFGPAAGEALDGLAKSSSFLA